MPMPRGVLRNNQYYCDEVFFFVGQEAEAEGQQQVLVAQHFFAISGHVFFDPWLEAHPVKPMVATQATVRRVRSDFITWQL